MEPLAVGLWLAAAGGVVAVLVAVAVPQHRRRALLLGAVLFLPIGVLGILSVGAIFLLAAVGCLTAAALTRPLAHRTRTGA